MKLLFLSWEQGLTSTRGTRDHPKNPQHDVLLQALKILNDEMQCDVIKIGGLVRNKVSPSHMAMRPPGSVSIESLLSVVRMAMFRADVTSCNAFVLMRRRNL